MRVRKLRPSELRLREEHDSPGAGEKQRKKKPGPSAPAVEWPVLVQIERLLEVTMAAKLPICAVDLCGTACVAAFLVGMMLLDESAKSLFDLRGVRV